MKFKVYEVGQTVILKKSLVNNRQYSMITFFKEAYDGDLTIAEVYLWLHLNDVDYRLKNGHIVNRRCIWRAKV